MPVDTPLSGFHNSQGAKESLMKSKASLEWALEEAISRALRDNLAPLQRTADELHQAYADLVAACSSSRPSNTLPAMLRAQTAASALAAGLSVLSNFVAVAVSARERRGAEYERSATALSAVELEEEESLAPIPPPAEEVELESESAERTTDLPAAEAIPAMTFEEPVGPDQSSPSIEFATHEDPVLESLVEAVAEEAPIPETQTFDIGSLPPEIQDLHRRANRAAKVTMQDIKLLRPQDVALGREQKDICGRLRSDLDKARKEYDRRFRAILDHPVDYFHRWMVEILANGDTSALGDYPYPSPVLRR
jgi:hypothetical protein